MAFKNYNPNPQNNLVIDCTVRAISKATGQSWDETYIGLQSLPQNFNPQAIAQQMVNSGQVSQQQLQQAMQIANQLTGRQ